MAAAGVCCGGVGGVGNGEAVDNAGTAREVEAGVAVARGRVAIVDGVGNGAAVDGVGLAPRGVPSVVGCAVAGGVVDVGAVEVVRDFGAVAPALQSSGIPVEADGAGAGVGCGVDRERIVDRRAVEQTRRPTPLVAGVAEAGGAVYVAAVAVGDAGAVGDASDIGPLESVDTVADGRVQSAV